MNKTISTLKNDILPLSLPLIVEQALIVSMGLVNAILATNLGREVASAIGIVDTLTVMVVAFAQAMALGGTVVVAQHTGRKDDAAANHAVTQAVLSGAVIGIILCVFFAVFRRPSIEILFQGLEPSVQTNAETYLGITAIGYPFLILSLVASGVLRGAGDARLPMLINIGINILNAAAGYVLMYGFGPIPSFGIAGAAWAITIARSAGGLVFLFFLVSGTVSAKLPRLKNIRYDSVVLKTILVVGIPASIESLVFNGGKLITQMYSVGLGTAAITANYIATALAGFTQIPAAAMSMAAAPIVGIAVGRDHKHHPRQVLKTTVLFSTAVLFLCCIPMFFLAENFIRLYTRDADILAQAVSLVRLFCVTAAPLWSLSFVLPSGLRGGGDSRYVMYTAIASMWTVRVGLGYLLGILFGWGMLGIWIAMAADWVIRSVLYVVRFLKNKWIHVMGRDQLLPADDPGIK